MARVERDEKREHRIHGETDEAIGDWHYWTSRGYELG